MIAWLIDAGMTAVFQGVAVILALAFENFEWTWLASMVSATLSALVLLVTMAVQCRWGTTLGKYFFQLAIVDPHGVRPPQRLLALRVLSQFPWLALFFTPILSSMGLEFVDILLSGVAFLWVGTNCCFVLFRTDQLALHDRLLRTRVVVDAGDMPLAQDT
jgi:uncharacterized RDD family membrane protein YckC